MLNQVPLIYASLGYVRLVYVSLG